MPGTKEIILNTALHLFAQDGYDAVSVSAIAGEIGITKGALYKHYKNKRDIFDSIVKKMFDTDAERSKEFNVPEEEYEKERQSYENTSIESVKSFTLAQFEFWMNDDFGADFRKMLMLEQFKNEEMARLYENCISKGPVLYMEDIFGEMVKRGILKEENCRQLAIEFYAPFYLLLAISDHSKNKAQLSEYLKIHIEKFFKEKQK